MINNLLATFFKGLAMGAANVIPGVSGGTIALITGIFERLIHGIKSVFSANSIKLFFSFKLKEWAKFVDFNFLLSLVLGVFVAILSIAKLFEFLFAEYPVYVWAFFFGLVLASVYFVGKTIEKWNVVNISFFIFGTAIAVILAIMKPASENSDVLYLLLSGAIAACSMILPGLSGSFVLVLMGNYELVMINAVNDMNLSILLPIVIGAVVGLLGFSYILSWIFKKFKDQTIAILTGFIFGSLLVIWPWKQAIWKVDNLGNEILSRSGDKIVERYQWLMPQQFNTETLVAFLFIVLGIVVIALTELSAGKQNKGNQ